ncbi:MAG: hypothetical protein AAFR62_12700 [Cyanobacteria bacterium J06629_2]
MPVSFGDDEGGAYAPDRPKDGTGRIRVCASQTTEPAVTVGQIQTIGSRLSGSKTED